MNASWLLSRGKPSSGQRITTSRRKATVIVASAALAFSGALLLAPSAQAVHELNLIELDGNAVTNNAAFDDWDSVCKAVTITNDTTSSIPDQCASAGGLLASNTAVAWANDGAQNATIFTTGGSKDPQNLTGLAVEGPGRRTAGQGQPAGRLRGPLLLPRHDDLSSAGTATTARSCSSAPTASTTAATPSRASGSSRTRSRSTPATGKFVGVHKIGDLLDPQRLQQRRPRLDDQHLQVGRRRRPRQPRASSTGGADRQVRRDADDAFCGIVNPANGTTSPWPFIDKSGNTTYLQGEFYEGGVNLSDRRSTSRASASRASPPRHVPPRRPPRRSRTSSSASSPLQRVHDDDAERRRREPAPSRPGMPVTDLAVVPGSRAPTPPTRPATSRSTCAARRDRQLRRHRQAPRSDRPFRSPSLGPTGRGTGLGDVGRGEHAAAARCCQGQLLLPGELPGDANYPDALTETATRRRSASSSGTIPTTTVTTPSDGQRYGHPQPHHDGRRTRNDVVRQGRRHRHQRRRHADRQRQLLRLQPGQVTGGVWRLPTGGHGGRATRRRCLPWPSNPPAASALSDGVRGEHRRSVVLPRHLRADRDDV